MKIILYRDGAAGVAVKLQGDEPTAELEELLGGELAMRTINERLSLATKKRVTPGSRGLTTERSESAEQASHASLRSGFAQSDELGPPAEGVERDKGAGADGEAVFYALHRLGREIEPIVGNCAIIGVGVEGRLRDISVQDMAAAECYIRRLGEG